MLSGHSAATTAHAGIATMPRAGRFVGAAIEAGNTWTVIPATMPCVGQEPSDLCRNYAAAAVQERTG